MAETPEMPLITPNIFGFHRYFLKFSPYNCEKGPFRFVFVIISLTSFFAMIFRSYWMSSRLNTSMLSLGWAEQKLFASISIESFSCIIALYRITEKGSLKKFESALAMLKKMRKNPYYESYDSYGGLRRKIVLSIIPIPVAFVGTAAYLLCSNRIIYDTTTTSSWYQYFDAPVMVLCAYVNVLFLPIHVLIQNGIAREFNIFNEELENSSKNKELMNIKVLQNYADRQIKLFDYTNLLTSRLNPFMVSTPLLALTALACAIFIVTNFYSSTPILYYFCMVGLLISCSTISSSILYPSAMVQEAMLRTSNVLMNDHNLHYSSDPQIYSTYRMMVDRAQNNRAANFVMLLFHLNKANVGRAYFVTSNIVLIMSILHGILH